MSLLLKSAVRLLGRSASRRLEKAAAHPSLAQRQFLFKTLSKNAETTFGRLHKFAGIRTEQDFRRQVPVRDYEAFRPFVERILSGERSVLTGSEPFMLTMTSGTTGEPKFIPVTDESKHLDGVLMNRWFYGALKDHPSFLDAQGLGIVSKAVEGTTASGLPYGSMSGLTYKNLPFPLRRIQSIPYDVFETQDYDERYLLMARFALAARISFIATPNPSTLVRLAQVCDERREELIRAVHDGSLGARLSSQPELLPRLTARLRPNRARAAALARIVERTGALRPRDFWPDLKLIGCWVGGSLSIQAQKLAEHYGHVTLRDLGYMASEGHFTVPLADHSPAGLLAVGHNYYEFIPEEEVDSSQPVVLSCAELELGRRYSILLTTAAGLYRYRIGDVVEVTGFYGRAPLLSFIRKEGEAANITGEKMHVNHLILAAEHLKKRFALRIEQFRAAPDFINNRYEIYLELGDAADEKLLADEALPEFDRALGLFNLEYAQKRRSRRLQPPRLHLMRHGWADEERRRHVRAGKRDAQYKWRILCPEAQASDLHFVTRTIETEGKTPAQGGQPVPGSLDAPRHKPDLAVA